MRKNTSIKVVCLLLLTITLTGCNSIILVRTYPHLYPTIIATNVYNTPKTPGFSETLYIDGYAYIERYPYDYNDPHITISNSKYPPKGYKPLSNTVIIASDYYREVKTTTKHNGYFYFNNMTSKSTTLTIIHPFIKGRTIQYYY